MSKEDWICELKVQAKRLGFPEIKNQMCVLSLNMFALKCYADGKSPEQTVKEAMNNMKVGYE